MTREAFLDYLASVHGRTRKLVALIPDEHLEWAPASGKFTLGDIVRHLANIERWMYAETVHGRPSRYRGHDESFAKGKEAVVAYYEQLHEESRALFAALTDAQWEEKCLTPAGTPITIWKWLRAMIEHEAHHRGQLYLMLGMLGVATPPIYGLTSEQVSARAIPD